MGSKQIDFSTAAKDGLFVYVFPAIILSFILISLWADVITKFYYNTLGFSRRSTAQSFFLAALLTFCLGVFVSLMPNTH